MDSVLRRVIKKIPSEKFPHSCFKREDNTTRSGNFARIYDLIRSERKLFHFSENISNYYINYHTCPLLMLMTYRDLLQKTLQIKENVLSQAKTRLEFSLSSRNETKIKNLSLVGVHVRRTDYLKYVNITKNRLPPEKFYSRAFDFYRKRFVRCFTNLRIIFDLKTENCNFICILPF